MPQADGTEARKRRQAEEALLEGMQVSVLQSNRTEEQREHARQMERQRKQRARERQQWQAVCSWCGSSFALASAVSACPNESCAAKRRSLVCSGVEGKRRAEAMGGEVEHVRLIEVANRDNYRCHVCGEKVDPLAPRSSRSLSFDHVVPIELGGAHVAANIRVAHLGHNSGRRVEEVEA